VDVVSDGALIGRLPGGSIAELSAGEVVGLLDVEGRIAASMDAMESRAAWVSPYDFGAVGDGVADDSAAFRAMWDNVVSTATGGTLVTKKVWLGCGTFLITEPGALADSPTSGSGPQLRNVHMEGIGPRSCEIVFSSDQGAASDPSAGALMVLRNRIRGGTFRGFSVNSTNPNQTFAYLFTAAGGAQNRILWDDVELRGTWKRGWAANAAVDGDQNSEMKWHRCGASNSASFSDAICASGFDPWHPQQNQALNWWFDHCTWEFDQGSVIRMDMGGFVHIVGGSWINGINGGSGTMIVMNPGTGTPVYDQKHLVIDGTRFEVRQPNAILDTDWGGSSTLIDIRGISVATNKLTNPAGYKLAHIRTGTTVTPTVGFTSCQLPGYVLWDGAGPGAGGRLVFDRCLFRDNTGVGTASGFLRYNPAATPRYRFRDCYGVTDEVR